MQTHCYFFFQRCAPASIRLVDNEQFKFGKSCLSRQLFNMRKGFKQQHDDNYIYSEFIFLSHTVFCCQYVGWCFIDVLFTSERRTMNGNGTACNDFTFFSTELLN